MGSSASKATRAAAGAAARKYPSRPSPSTQTPASAPPPKAGRRGPGPTNHPPPQASSSRDEAVNLDGSDPQYAANLRRIGVVQPNPFYSPPTADPHETVSSYRPSPTSPSSQPRSLQTAETSSPPPSNFFPPTNVSANPALRILQARQQLQEEAERELDEIGKKGFEGRKFVDVGSIRDALSLRESGLSEGEIEKRLGLKRGSVKKLGPSGVVENTV